MKKTSYNLHPMETPLHIPNGKGYKSLRVYCYRCKTLVYDRCKETDQKIERCKYGKDHRFKVIVPIPGEKYARKTKTLETRNLLEAIEQAVQFEKEVTQTGIQKVFPKEITPERVVNKNIPQLLIHALARDIGRLNNEGVPEHRIEHRTEEHIKDVQRAFKVLIECLKENEYNINTFKLDD